MRVDDADKYQGQNVTFACVEEAGQYPDPKPIDRLHAVLRSAAGVPTQLVLTGNPGGAGQHWLRHRYIDPHPAGNKLLDRRVTDDVSIRYCYIPSRLADNKYLGKDYVARLHMVGSDELVRAWLYGDWDAVEGAFFDCWSHERHVLKPFTLPDHWVRFRSMDWGSASPFSVCWWAVASEDMTVQGKIIPRGAMIHYREWYGASEPNVGLKMTAEDVGLGIISRETRDEDIRYSVLDPAAFATDGGPSIAERMAKATDGKALFRKADNRRVGTRGAMGGWDQMRARMVGNADGHPMLFVFDTCKDFIRTVPLLQHDSARIEDLDTESEDHIADAARYGCMSRPYTRAAPKAADDPTRQPTFDELMAMQPDKSERI